MIGCRSLRRVIAPLFFLGCVVSSRACGPFLSEAVFVESLHPDGPYADYVKGKLGVPGPSYRLRHLVVAYDWLNGTPLSASEQQQAVALDNALEPPDASAGDATSPPRLSNWVTVREGSGVTSATTDAVTGSGSSSPIAGAEGYVVDRSVPGVSYQSFANCLDDAFETAAATYQDRKAAHSGDEAALADWLRGQEDVFSNCPEDGKEPAQAPADAPLWLRKDRAYQQAAAAFYRTDYDQAFQQLRAIAADGASPWHQTARLVMARAMIRHATVGEERDLPPALAATSGRPALAQQPSYEQVRAYQKAQAQQAPARLSEARQILRGILADPSMASYHQSAARLLDLVMLSLDPAAQAKTLTARLTAPDRAQTPGRFAQALVDLRVISQRTPRNASADHPEPGPSSDDLSVWMGLFSLGESSGTPAQAALAAGYAQALARWRQAHSPAWLVAALALAQPGSPSLASLLSAAEVLPSGSPAVLPAKYYSLRAAGPTPQTRAKVLALMPSLEHSQTRSTINLFAMLLQRASPDLADFLAHAGTLPTAETDDGDDEDNVQPLSHDAKADGLCHVTTSPAETPLFDHDVATILNTRLPLSLLAQAATQGKLAANLRFGIAQSAWTRAVLLNRPDVARRLSSVLSGCYPAWQPWLDRYDHASSAQDGEANGLLALMRFASTEPIVRDGEQRPGGFATYSEYRDNWWQPSLERGIDGTNRGNFFGTMPAGEEELPDPTFLSAEDKATAAQEVKSLRQIPCASDYFAQAALSWQKAHAADPRTPDILGFAERVVRSGCHTATTSELNHQLFTVVQLQYPQSEWATKYKTWE